MCTMAVVGYIVIFSALVTVTWLGLRWTRLRPGQRRTTRFENPGDLRAPNEQFKRMDLPSYGGDATQSWWEE